MTLDISKIGVPIRILAYGENRYQSPAKMYAYFDAENDPLSWKNFQVISGDPSYISIADGDRALRVLCLIAEAHLLHLTFLDGSLCTNEPYIAVVCKHGNPCGVGLDFKDPRWALIKALLGDPIAAMGGELMTNFIINDELAWLAYEVEPADRKKVGRQYWGLDVLFAPEFSPKAVELLGKKQRRRLLANPHLCQPRLSREEKMLRPIRGGFLTQEAPSHVLNMDVEADPLPNLESSLTDCNIILAWAVAWSATSNSVALAKDGQLIGLGCGQQDRIFCVQLCLQRAKRSGHSTVGSYFASDGFFPYARRKRVNRPLEGPELLVKAGCQGGVVPFDGKEREEVRKFFTDHNCRVVYLPPEYRGFSQH